MFRLLDFHRGQGTDARGRTLANLWAYSDRVMEAVHDFIQWMFPLGEPSQFNPNTLLLTDDDIAAFAAAPALAAAMGRPLDRFLALAGLKLVAGPVVEADDFARKRSVWTYPNHNWLRTTRVLTSARTLGQDEASRDFFRFQEAGRDSGTIAVDDHSVGYWSAAGRG